VVTSLDDVHVIGVVVVVVVVILWALNILCKLGINVPGGIVLLLIPTKSGIREVAGGSSEVFPYSTNYNKKIFMYILFSKCNI
jgi:hypothetical protein